MNPAAASNLSDAQFGYDLVVATTQKSINSTMAHFLDRATFMEVIGCFLKGERKGDKPQPISYEELKKKANNADPFVVPDNAKDDDPAVVNLRDARFMGGFKATIGLPSTPTFPSIVTLDKDDAGTVTFNLLCGSFQITGFDYNGYWNNKSQPTTGNPWYFSTKVKLRATVIDHTSPTLPADVKAEITKRLNAGTFSIQQLLMDLDTAADFSTLKLEGLDGTDPIAILVNATFCQAYLDQVKKDKGHPILGYSFVTDKPDASSFDIGAISRETCPFLDPSNNPYSNPDRDQQDAATFNYLCTTSKTPPTANRFKWNWVDVNSPHDGVMALKRNLFLDMLQARVTHALENRFCFTAQVDFTSGNEWYPTFSGGGKSVVTSQIPQTIPTPLAPPVTLPLLTMAYQFSTHAQSKVRYWSDLNIHFYAWAAYSCQFTATVMLSMKDQQIWLELGVNAKVQAQYGHYEGAVWYQNLSNDNYLDYSAQIATPLRITDKGGITLDTSAKPTNVTSNNAGYGPSSRGTLGMGTETVKWLDKPLRYHILDVQQRNIQDSITNLAAGIAAELESSKGWIFPGGRYFLFADVGCSNFLDLVTHIKYADIPPSS